MSSAAPTSKPVRLELRANNVWKPVMRFDAADDYASQQVMVAAQRLGDVDTTLTWRICKDDALRDVLLTWTAQKGWVQA